MSKLSGCILDFAKHISHKIPFPTFHIIVLCFSYILQYRSTTMATESNNKVPEKAVEREE